MSVNAIIVVSSYIDKSNALLETVFNLHCWMGKGFGFIVKWIRQFLIIMIVTFLGEVLRYLIPFAIPSGIYGLVLLFGCLCTGLIKLDQVEKAADFLVEIMPFFFIPAGVGLMTKWLELKTMLIPFLLAVIVVTALVMVVTGHVAQWLMRRKGGKGNE